MAEVMPCYSGKRKLYGLKVEVSVNPQGLAINCSDHARGNTPDITMFRNNVEFHDSTRLKTESDRNLPDNGPLVTRFPDEWGLLADKGYQALRSRNAASTQRREEIYRALANNSTTMSLVIAAS
ncbi:hypothetical protein PC119_g20676 [Phytophthora cactorum]|uniref:DDE Tnp4 domain-containing protein n=1 Tax=Phytophthora cactorum TaxID=29920 RepID=A0A8T1BPD5_9STRA|nr:hypothetical protein PC117_g20977 [Phytophthora cactorum]KAG2983051.1 hypothetical protein PC119_g20676 [Phytophthora cactorum]KAG3176276.1 hypothetical protein C6341_g9041 [Phytophthora cactorum]